MLHQDSRTNSACLAEALQWLFKGIAADAGFVGYDLAAMILDRDAQLVMRVGSNVRLLKKLGFYVREFSGIVYLWPDKAARKDKPPLVFRLVVMQGPKHPVYLITSVLDPQRLSDAEVIEISKARWGIEVYHRHLKQTFGRRKLLSRKAKREVWLFDIPARHIPATFRE